MGLGEGVGGGVGVRGELFGVGVGVSTEQISD